MALRIPLRSFVGAFAFLLVAGSATSAPSAYRVVRGEIAATGDEWTAGAKGAVLAFPEGTVYTLGPGARVAARPTVALPLGGTGRAPTRVVHLLSGALGVDDPAPTAKSRQGVMVQITGKLAAVTAGGHLDALVGPDHSIVANRSGVAWVTPGGNSRKFEPGTGFITSPTGDQPFPLLQTPQATAKRRVFSAIQRDASVDGIGWGAIVGAKKYVVRLFGSDPVQALETQEATEPAQPRAFARVPAGDYAVTVAAVDSHGFEGPPSRPVDLRVVGVDLPPGGSVTSSGGLSVPEQSSVTFTHTAGLVFNNGAAATWAPVPPSVSLLRGGPTLVRIRDPRDPEGLNVFLRPRAVSVAVEVGPKRLCWPGAAAHIAIRAVDTAGGDPISTADLHPVVTIGVDLVKMDFVKEGAALSGSLPAPSDAGHGPWVLRVQVKDQFGSEIGRDFVEIKSCGASKPPA